MTTRFSGLAPVLSAALLGLLALVVVATLLAPEPQLRKSGYAGHPAAYGEEMSDAKHYRMVVSAVASGEGYYEAAARLQRSHDFPLKPFFTVRLPTLAVMSAALGPIGTTLAGGGLMLAMVLAWNARLKELNLPQPIYVGVLAAMAFGGATLCSPAVGVFHECWSGVLIALSLGLWRPGRYRAAVIAGFAACLFRELAVPYLALMAVAAAWDRRWSEVAAWGAAIAAFAMVLGWHAAEVATVVRPDDLASQGWNGHLGWAFYIFSVTQTTPLNMLPPAPARAIVVASLFGWLAWRSEYGWRPIGLIAGYALLVMLFARVELFYWSLMSAPLVLAGIAFAPLALRDLAVQAAELLGGRRAYANPR